MPEHQLEMDISCPAYLGIPRTRGNNLGGYQIAICSSPRAQIPQLVPETYVPVILKRKSEKYNSLRLR